MRVFRIGKAKYIPDLAGTGARLFGGRWNYEGEGVLYTSENRSLAMLETLVHSELHLLPDDLILITIEISCPVDGIEKVDLSEYEMNWKQYPQENFTKQIGSEWLNSNRSHALSVPSAVMPMEKNILLNPAHPQHTDVKIVDSQPLKIDTRLVLRK